MLQINSLNLNVKIPNEKVSIRHKNTYPKIVSFTNQSDHYSRLYNSLRLGEYIINQVIINYINIQEKCTEIRFKILAKLNKTYELH